MKYDDFIDELKPLLKTAYSLFDEEHTYQSSQFRKWLHQITSIIDAIEDHGYKVNCDIKSRIFQNTSFGPISVSEESYAYNQDLQDTVNEIETIIQYYERYGSPRRVQEDGGRKMSDSESENPVANKKTIKERFESHPVVWGLTLLVTGFIAGFGARTYLLLDETPETQVVPTACVIEGLDILEETHHTRIKALQEQLINLEAKASDHSSISSFQRNYKESADRVRADIIAENSAYQETITRLSRKCQ